MMYPRGRAKIPPGSHRYTLKIARWTVVREPGQSSPRRLNSPGDTAALATDLLRDADDDKEHFWALLLNAQNGLIHIEPVSVGTMTASLVHPRDVFGPALREGAASIVLVHNHPSGDATPSAEDIRLTRQLVDVAKFHDIRLHDHVVIGNGTMAWRSLAEQGVI